MKKEQTTGFPWFQEPGGKFFTNEVNWIFVMDLLRLLVPFCKSYKFTNPKVVWKAPKLVHCLQVMKLLTKFCMLSLAWESKATLIKSVKDKLGMGKHNIKLLSTNRWVCFIWFERTEIRGIHVLLWRKWKRNRATEMKRKPWGKKMIELHRKEVEWITETRKCEQLRKKALRKMRKHIQFY